MSFYFRFEKFFQFTFFIYWFLFGVVRLWAFLSLKRILLNAYLFVRRDLTAINLDECLVKSTNNLTRKKRGNEKKTDEIPSDYWVWKQTHGLTLTHTYYTFAQTMPNAHSARSYLLWNHCVVKLFKLTAMIFTFSFVFALELYCSQKWKGKSGEFSRFIFETTKTKPTFFINSSGILSNYTKLQIVQFLFNISYLEFSLVVLYNSLTIAWAEKCVRNMHSMIWWGILHMFHSNAFRILIGKQFGCALFFSVHNGFHWWIFAVNFWDSFSKCTKKQKQ